MQSHFPPRSVRCVVRAEDLDAGDETFTVLAHPVGFHTVGGDEHSDAHGERAHGECDVGHDPSLARHESGTTLGIGVGET